MTEHNFSFSRRVIIKEDKELAILCNNYVNKTHAMFLKFVFFFGSIYPSYFLKLIFLLIHFEHQETISSVIFILDL